MTTPNPQCSKCRCYWQPDECDTKTSGLQFKTCKKCRGQKQEDKILHHYGYYNEKISCKCGGTYTINHMSRHNKTKRHQQYQNTLNS